MMLFSQRQKLAAAVERRTRKDERVINARRTATRVCLIRDEQNTIRQLDAYGLASR